MKSSIPAADKDKIFGSLSAANRAFQKLYPGDSGQRQPVHTVYGGANLFSSDIAEKMGKAALAHLELYAPNFCVLAKALELDGHAALPTAAADVAALEARLQAMNPKDGQSDPAWMSYTIYNKMVAKLKREPLEDFRIDFEDGFGNRSDEEEDQFAEKAALEVAKGMQAGSLSPFIGIRIKPFTEDLKDRGLRTMDIFVSTLADATGGKLPENFVVMLPKVTIPEQISALIDLFEVIEANSALESGALKMEIMVEQTQAIMASDGTNPLKKFMDAARGRMVATAFGTYDYTASCNITAKYQAMSHPVCDFAHHMTRVALGHTGLMLADGATNVMPVGPHRGDNLSPVQILENMEVVHRAWKLGYDHVRHSLYNGFYQGWDLHPAQFPIRYAAVYAFFLESYDDAAARLRNFMQAAARVTLSGDIFDDAATGQGLLNYFIAALNCGAITEAEALATGLTMEELRSRSFVRILRGRRGQ
ncbi:MAG: phosphoenolpyruvate kinase [Bacteroidetes bacterium]|nr:phosphoenolpyruvate kinase [Bacteroidota bacterium]